MDFSYTTEQETLRREVVKFARDRLNAGVIDRDRDQEFSHELWLACGEMGIQGLPVPESLGGSGLDALTTTIALEALGYGCRDNGLVFSVCAHLLSCVIPLWKFGSEDQQRRWLPALCHGTKIGVHAMTEPGSGSDSFALSTRAEADGDTYRISGSKTFITNAPVADLIIVFARTESAKSPRSGISAFLVERGTPGLTVSKKIEKMGLRTSPFGEVSLDDVRVPREAVLGGLGAGNAIFSHAMDWERVLLFGAHVGMIERLLELGVQYARQRRQSGRPIGKFQGVSHKLADLKVQLEAARLLLYRAATRLEKTRAVALDAAMTKLFVSESLVRGALDVLQIFAGYGYCTEFEIEREVRDALGSKIYSGTSEVQRNIIASWLHL